MNRLLVFALVASIGNTSVAFAGESLLSSAARHVQQIAATETAAPASPVATTAAPLATAARPQAASFQQGGGNLSQHGMSKSKKALIYIGLAAGFAASVWAIDHGVKDVTPSSLGTRQD